MKQLLLLLLALVFVLPVTADQWCLETVDSSGYLGTYASLALDSRGSTHISYFDVVGINLKYAQWSDSSWTIETVDSAGEVGQFTSLALDSSGNPHISYFDDTNDDLKYARWNGSSWEMETVDAAGEVGQYTSLALDYSDNPHISYYDWTNKDLKYARWNGSSWVIETVDAADRVGSHTSLALDESSNPHISYYDSEYDDLKYARWNGSSWQIETVDSGGNVGLYTSLDIDSSGNPHISYHYDSGWDLKYARWNGASWEIETVDSAGYVGFYTSLRLDSSDNPHISYSDNSNSSNYELDYAHWNGSNWVFETVESGGNAGRYTSLALDDADKPCISYYDDDGHNLKYAWYNTPPPAFSLLSPSDGSAVEAFPLCDWEDAPDYPTVSYDLWYSTEYDFDPHEELTGLIDSEYQFSDAELDPDTIYHWKVRAWDGYEETWSNETWSFYVPHDVGLDGVELAASPADDGVIVVWAVDVELPAAFRVLRGAENPVAVSGSLDGATRRWLDRDVSPGGSYVYWIEATDSDGYVKRFGPTAAVVVPEQTQRLSLDEPYPNPASGSVSVAFTLPEAQRVSLAVYDLAGRRVTTLSEGELPAGRHEVAWNCAAASAGVYLLRLETQGAALSRRMVVGRVVDR